MTDPTALADTLRLVAGAAARETAAVPVGAGIALRCSDGSHGIAGRQPSALASCTPCGTALAATWDGELVEAAGALVGADARRLGVHVVLAPVLNLPRSPLGGRAFECFGEDPLLSGTLAAAWVRGVQAQGVAATPKHFVCNDAETARRHVDCVVDERALRELYLVPFELALAAGAWGLMTAYNRVNGTPCCEHHRLLVDVVRGEWGWDGLIMTDWYAVSSPVSAASGVDLEMPGPPRAFGLPLREAVERGEVTPARLDEMAASVRRLAGRVQPDAPWRRFSRDAARSTLRRAAAGAFTLLRNEGSLLPLVPGGTLAVIGPAATDPCLQGGGTSWVAVGELTDPLRAIAARYGEASVIHARGCAAREDGLPLHLLDVRATHRPEQPGLTLEFRPDADPHARAPELVRSSVLTWTDGVPGRIRVTAMLTAERAGLHRFTVSGTDPVRLRVDGRLVESAAVPARPWFTQAVAACDARLRPDRAGRVEIEMDVGARPFHQLSFACRPPADPDALQRACDAARRADAVVLVVGTHEQLETQGADRTTTALPGLQQELAQRVIAANPATAVIVNAGAPVDLEWARGARALMYGWFAGDEFGPALAAVLCGELEPGGRLPVTLAASPADYGAWATAPDGDGRLRYAESLHVGYRHFDAAGIEPEFCFGHGLGYTEFAYEHARAAAAGEHVVVDVTVRNVGRRAGKEVVQVYVAPPPGPMSRALGAFAAVHVAAGARAEVRLTLAPRAFSVWDVERGAWCRRPGDYELQIGRSSRDIRRVCGVRIGATPWGRS